MANDMAIGNNYKVNLELKLNGSIITDRAFTNVGIAGNTNPQAAAFDFAQGNTPGSFSLSVALIATGSGILSVTADCTYNKTNGDNVTESQSATMQFTVTTAPDSAELVLVLEQI